jgi:hypothetical protein
MTDYFKPALTLHHEKNGEYTLDSVTLAPNSCYSPGRARVGAPPNVRLIPEAQPVVLELAHARHLCPMHVTPIKHHLRHLNLAGKINVIAFVMLDDKVLGSASIAVHDAQERPHPPAPIVHTHDWYAWVNAMPGAEPSLHVQGVATLPTPGYAVSLEVDRGGTGGALVLDLHVKQLPGIWPQVVTERDVRHDEAHYKRQYSQVVVRTGDGEVTIPIDEVV